MRDDCAENLDVLALTETRQHDSGGAVCLRQSAPMDFAIVNTVRLHQPGYGGIAVLYGSQLRCKKVSLLPTTSFEALCVRFRVGNSAWLLLTIYQPGSCQPTATFFYELSTVLEMLINYGCPVVIGGDFNIHV